MGVQMKLYKPSANKNLSFNIINEFTIYRAVGTSQAIALPVLAAHFLKKVATKNLKSAISLSQY